MRGKPELLTAVLVAALGAGCAAATASKQARDAEFRRDYDRAVVEYTKALRLKPGNPDIRDGLTRAKARAADDHLQRARRLAAVGKFDEAVVEYGVAAELVPANMTVDEELRATRNKLRARVAVSREGKTELQSLIERTRNMAPPGLDLPQNVKMPASLTFREASSRDVFTAIARFAGISVVFDSQFRDAPVTVDLRNATLDDALAAVTGATRTFFRVNTPQTVMVVPDTPAKRREYEEEIVRTFYLSNADLKETMDMLRLVLDARRLSFVTANNAIVIKDTPERIAAASRVLAAIDKARPEVIIDVQLLEVDRTKLLEYGLQVASAGSPGIAGGVAVATDANQALTLQTLKNLSASDILLANLPAAPRLGRRRGLRQVRRPCPDSRDAVPAVRHRRHAAAAHHVLELREHRREHRHHATDAPRRRRDADAECVGVEHLRDGVRRSADNRQSRDQDADSTARRRNQHAGGAHSR